MDDAVTDFSAGVAWLQAAAAQSIVVRNTVEVGRWREPWVIPPPVAFLTDGVLNMAVSKRGFLVPVLALVAASAAGGMLTAGRPAPVAPARPPGGGPAAAPRPAVDSLPVVPLYFTTAAAQAGDTPVRRLQKARLALLLQDGKAAGAAALEARYRGEGARPFYTWLAEVANLGVEVFEGRADLRGFLEPWVAMMKAEEADAERAFAEAGTDAADSDLRAARLARLRAEIALAKLPAKK